MVIQGKNTRFCDLGNTLHSEHKRHTERSCSTVTLRGKADHLIRAGRLNFEMVVCLCFHFIKDNWLEIRRQIEDANLLSPQITRFLNKVA